MLEKEILTLGIESSCDETSAAVLRGGRTVLSNVISTQIPIHQKFGGVVPEIASRKHIVNIMPVMGKRAALFYLTRGSVETIWIPVAIFTFALIARKVDDWRFYALTSLFGLAACVLASMRLDLYQAAVYLAVALCCGLSAIKSRGY